MAKRNLHLDNVSKWTWVQGEEGSTMLVEKKNGDIERRHVYSLRDAVEVTGSFPENDKTDYVKGYRNLVKKLLKKPIH